MKNYYTPLPSERRLHSLFTFLFIAFGSMFVSAQTYAPLPYYNGFEAGLGTEWTTTSSQTGTNIEIIPSGILTFGGLTANAYAGNNFLGMDYETGGVYNLNQADLHLNTTGTFNMRLSFRWAEWNDETEAEDGVYVSDDNGVTFTKVLDLNGASYTDLEYQYFDMSLDSINTIHGLSYSTQYIIRFQQYDNYYFAGGNDGHLYDEINIYSACATSSSISASDCNSYTVPSGNQTYTTSGIYTDTLTNSVLCDSIITIDLTITTPPPTNLTEFVCGPYLSPAGNTYATSGIYNDTLLTTLGCDSVIVIDLTVNAPTSSSITESSCNSYVSPSGMVYTSSAIFNDTILSSVGCDSVITIDLTVNSPSSSSMTESVCNSYLSPSGNTYTSSGIYTDTLFNSNGCDSLITIDLTINTPTTSVINDTVLDTYTAPSGSIYTTSGQYTDTISNAAGCDSIITINLIVEYTGLFELSSENISSYPNPVTHTLLIQGIHEKAEITSVLIVDMNGRVIQKMKPSDSGYDVKDLLSGSYYLIVESDKGKARLQFVKL